MPERFREFLKNTRQVLMGEGENLPRCLSKDSPQRASEGGRVRADSDILEKWYTYHFLRQKE
jgi:hypothetical protein